MTTTVISIASARNRLRPGAPARASDPPSSAAHVGAPGLLARQRRYVREAELLTCRECKIGVGHAAPCEACIARIESELAAHKRRLAMKLAAQGLCPKCREPVKAAEILGVKLGFLRYHVGCER